MPPGKPDVADTTILLRVLCCKIKRVFLIYRVFDFYMLLFV